MAERFEAFVIKVADKDDSRRVIGWIFGESLTVSTEKLGEQGKPSVLFLSDSLLLFFLEYRIRAVAAESY